MSREFDHVGLPTDDVQPNEMYVAETKVWVTDPATHPYKVEFLRYEEDSPVKGPVRELPHMAFRVDDLEQAMAGCEVLLGPVYATATMRDVFGLSDGAVFEFMASSEAGHWFTPGKGE
jgi:hypothetical protein